MKKLHKDWTYEKLKKEALKYQTKRELEEQSPRAYSAIKSKKLLKELCSHMENQRGRECDKDEVKIEALKYKTRGEFSKLSSKAYAKGGHLAN